MITDRILISKESVPCRFDILLGDELFALTLNYNKSHDFFTVGLERDGESLCEGEPVVYGFPLFKDFYRAGSYPAIDIVPRSSNDEVQEVSFEAFGKTVFLTIDNQEGDSIE